MPESLRATPRSLATWLFVLALVLTALWIGRDGLGEAHKTLALLLVVLGASARHGRVVGLAVAGLAFAGFNFFLLPPYYTLHLADPLDWSVLLGFLVTAGVAAQLFHRVQESLALAERRAHEEERFATMASESLAAPTAADAVKAVAGLIIEEAPVRWVQVFALGDSEGVASLVVSVPEDGGPAIDPGLLRFALRDRRIVALETDGTTHLEQPEANLATTLLGVRSHAGLLLPLYVREHPIGVVGLGDPAGLTLGADQVAFVDALTRYVALALERMRLAGEADAAAALREIDRLKDAFVATVSHDLRTPLTTIRALAAEMREADPDRAVIVEEEADRLNRLVADLLDLSRVRAGALPLDVQVTAAEDVVGAALQRLAGVAGGERIVVKLPPGGALPLGRFDFVHTLRVLCNLLENALKHAPGTAPVELEVDVRGAWLRFRVLDRGPGVPESERSRIFDAFFSKAPGDARAQGAGTGLGLAIAKSLAEAQGGSLAHAPRDGGGSVFTLELPAEPTPDLA